MTAKSFAGLRPLAMSERLHGRLSSGSKVLSSASDRTTDEENTASCVTCSRNRYDSARQLVGGHLRI